MREKILRALRECPRDSDPEEWLESQTVAMSSTYGGETPCVEVSSEAGRIILDAGTGLRGLGLEIMKRQEHTQRIHILLSHFHWDHIQGIPFFVPIYAPDAEIHFYSGREGIEDLLAQQQRSPFFPVDFKKLSSKLHFHHIKEEEAVGAYKVSVIAMNHPDVSYGYRVDDGKSCVVYLTDVELLEADRHQQNGYQEFVKGADLLIGDVQYGFMESHEKRTWGHSSIFNFIDLTVGAGVKALAFFHYDPASTDESIDELHEQAQEYIDSLPEIRDLRLIPSRVGLELKL